MLKTIALFIFIGVYALLLILPKYRAYVAVAAAATAKINRRGNAPPIHKESSLSQQAGKGRIDFPSGLC